MNSNIYQETAESLLTKLLKDKDLTLNDINLGQAIKSLLTGWQKMMYSLKEGTAKGGSYIQQNISEMEQFFNVKLGGAKRKPEKLSKGKKNTKKKSSVKRSYKRKKKKLQNLEKEYNQLTKKKKKY